MLLCEHRHLADQYRSKKYTFELRNERGDEESLDEKKMSLFPPSPFVRPEERRTGMMATTMNKDKRIAVMIL